MPPTAVVMNMFYTGLGIARSLGERGVPVIGLSSQRRIYGNFTRYARVLRAPDSRNRPEALLPWLLDLGKRLKSRAVIFPTRDDDAIFLDRFRKELQEHYILTVPESSVLYACLDKWQTYQWAKSVGVPAPRCWLVESEADLPRIQGELSYPCVLKAVAAYQWHKGDNWQMVGGRKAIAIGSWAELLAEYAAVGRAEKRVLLQELVPGSDDCLRIAACCLDRDSKWIAGFNTQKLLQDPPEFGTGCIVQAADFPELLEFTARLLESMRFTGIAEVEYKWNPASRAYQLIEINPRPWDQHRLGWASGLDLIYLTYCEHAGLPQPAMVKRTAGCKWVAEDCFIRVALRLLWRRDPQFRTVLRLLRGERIYAIWSAKDPLPLLIYAVTRFIPATIAGVSRAVWDRLLAFKENRKERLAYE
jgi:D-aspartate ligase